MKRFIKVLCFVLVFILGTGVLLTGCIKKNQSGQTVDEPDITLKYLQNEYADQLIRDGAEHVFGSIELTEGENDVINVKITAKQYVEDESKPKGYYIEDRNYEVNTVLAEDARCAFISGKVSLPSIMSAEDFVKAYNKDMEDYARSDKPKEPVNKMYDIYIMGDQIEMIIEKYIP